jgi:hypothetical protein
MYPQADSASGRQTHFPWARTPAKGSPSGPQQLDVTMGADGRSESVSARPGLIVEEHPMSRP